MNSSDTVVRSSVERFLALKTTLRRSTKTAMKLSTVAAPLATSGVAFAKSVINAMVQAVMSSPTNPDNRNSTKSLDSGFRAAAVSNTKRELRA